MRLFKKKSLHHKAKHIEKKLIEQKQKEQKRVDINVKNIIRKMNFEEYIGRTVTLYIDAGGEAGNGISGVLLEQTTSYIRLLVLPKESPSCTRGNECTGNNNNILLCLFCPFNENATIGTIAEIAVTSIVAFVHNILN